MHITRVYIDGFKRLNNFTFELNEKLNVIVGDNETGKTSVLEAITLVLKRQYDGRTIDYAIDPYLFNAATVAEFFDKRRRDEHTRPPQILIEAYFHDDTGDPALAKLKGVNNTKNEDCPRIRSCYPLSSTKSHGDRSAATELRSGICRSGLRRSTRVSRGCIAARTATWHRW
jgi:putative ATP-dependent endonuclease of the OLD family